MADKRLRPLAPASASPTVTPSSSLRPSVELPPRARSSGKSACDTCRTRKTGCDGARPVCKACRRLGKSHCVYTPRTRATTETIQELQTAKEENERLKEADSFLALLASASDSAATTLLQQFREDGDISSLLASSDHDAGGSDAPAHQKKKPLSGQSKLEFELMNRHPIAYPTLIPVDANHVDFSRMRNPDDASWSDEKPTFMPDTSLVNDIFEALSILSEGEQVIHDRLARRPSNSAGANTPHLASQVLCDDRLSQIKVDRWSNVKITNIFAARVLSLYLTTSHPVLGLFDAHLFLENAVSGTENFCSRLLFSALLASACQSYSHIESEGGPLSRLFYLEAIQLWQETEETNINSLTAVAASQLLSITALCNGNDAESIALLRAGTHMGKELGLFGVTESHSAKYWLDHHYDWVRAASHTAWGVFGWVTSRCLVSHAGHIERPPLLPIPGESQTARGPYSSRPLPNIAVAAGSGPSQQHGFQHTLPDYMGTTFPVLCKLWVIAHDFIWSYYDHEDAVAPILRAKLEQASATYVKLLSWADDLPIVMARGEENEHHAIIAHVFYHAIILDVFRPFMVMKGPAQSTYLDHFEASDATAATIYAASTDQLLRLALLYRAQFQMKFMSFLWHTALLYVVNVMLSKTSTKPDSTSGSGAGRSAIAEQMTSKFWMRLCLRGYATLYQSFPVVEKIVLGLLSIAMRNKVMTAEEARSAMNDMYKSVDLKPQRGSYSAGGSDAGQDEAGYQGHVGVGAADDATMGLEEEGLEGAKKAAPWMTDMADLDLSMSNPLASHTATLAARFDELALFEEFTTLITPGLGAEGEEGEGDTNASGGMDLDN